VKTALRKNALSDAGDVSSGHHNAVIVNAHTMATGFWKPGAPAPESARPLSLDVDRGQGGAELLPFNKHASLDLQQQRQRLPIWALRDALLYLVESHAVTVVVGATGCGKSTQLPQFLADAGWTTGGRIVACTQPRRVACQTVALRVAQERGCALGGAVGYGIRFEDVSTPGVTVIKYVTDGTLLRELLSDPLLSKYSVVIVDEAHERSASSDLLLGLLKKILRRRPELRVVVASATLEAAAVAKYFELPAAPTGTNDAAPRPSGTPAIISIDGRTFPVAVHYMEQPCSDFVVSTVEVVLAIHALDTPGDILCFLPGQAEIERAVALLRGTPACQQTGGEQRGSRGRGHLIPLPLYSGLPPAQQAAAFAPAPRSGNNGPVARKCVVASAVAETSLTMEELTFVVDCCFSRTSCVDPASGVEALVTVPASKASCAQRAGRAGRSRPGACYRLCTESHFTRLLPAAAVPEVQRTDCVQLVLQLKALGVDNLLGFEWLSPPPAAAMARALELLYSLGALDAGGGLTHPLGTLLAELPVPPALGRALLCSAELGCSTEMLTVAASLQVHSLWVAGGTGMLRSRAFGEAQAAFAAAEGDAVTALNVVSAYAKRSPQARGRWCAKHMIDARALARVGDVRRQLEAQLKNAGLPVQGPGATCGRDVTPVRRALTAGWFATAARLDTTTLGALDGPVYTSLRGGHAGLRLHIHPSSVLFRCSPPPATVVYATAVQTDKLYMHDVTAIEVQWLAELAPHFYTPVHKA